MPAQLTRFGIDRNSAILSIAWRVIFTLKFLFATENFFFFRTTVLLGGSSVKKLTELYDLPNCYALDFAGTDYPPKVSPSLCESCNYDGLIVILG